ncbi:MAG: phosphodiester glycosidase family protein, partial [Armatimonadetes bacterium]|nr:phosphodiester glycosidase family protein [Armatimonadota bacterium]
MIVVHLVSFANKGSGDSLQYDLRTVVRTKVHVVTVNLNDASLRLDLSVAEGLPAGDESFASLVAKASPLAAINGTFFSKATLKPTGDLVKDGKLLSFGGMGTAMAVDAHNNVTFQRVAWGRRTDWSNYETVLSCGPSLILRGHAEVDPEIEGFSDDHVLNPGSRSALGIDEWRRLKLVVVPTAITLSRLSAIMQQLGCTDAMNLDGGASTALYIRGKTIVAPSRRLTNLLIVRRRTPQSSAAPLKLTGTKATEKREAQAQNQQGTSALQAESNGTGAIPVERSPENSSQTPTAPASSQQFVPSVESAAPTPTGTAESEEREPAAKTGISVPGAITRSPAGSSNVTILNRTVSWRVFRTAAATLMVVLSLWILVATRELPAAAPMSLGRRMTVYLAALPVVWFAGMAVFGVVHDFLLRSSPLLSHSQDTALASVAMAITALVLLFFGPR